MNLKFWIINLVFRFSNEMYSTCIALSIGMQIKSYHKYIYDIVKTYNIYVRNFLTIGFNIQLYSIIFFNFENEITPSSPFKLKILSRKRKTFKNNPIFVILIYIWTGTFFQNTKRVNFPRLRVDTCLETILAKKDNTIRAVINGSSLKPYLYNYTSTWQLYITRQLISLESHVTGRAKHRVSGEWIIIMSHLFGILGTFYFKLYEHTMLTNTIES